MVKRNRHTMKYNRGKGAYYYGSYANESANYSKRECLGRACQEKEKVEDRMFDSFGVGNRLCPRCSKKQSALEQDKPEA